MSVKGSAVNAAEKMGLTDADGPGIEQKHKETALESHEGDHAKLRRAEAAAEELGLLDRVGARLDGVESYGEQVAEDKFGELDGLAGRAAQEGTVLTVVTLGITIIVGILIYSQIQSALPTPDNADLENASNNSTETFADAMELAPVIMLVLLAAVVLAVVQRFR